MTIDLSALTPPPTFTNATLASCGSLATAVRATAHFDLSQATSFAKTSSGQTSDQQKGRRKSVKPILSCLILSFLVLQACATTFHKGIAPLNVSGDRKTLTVDVAIADAIILR
eukprot:COSAG06_NODE_2364_length_7003_cov_3.258980_5_plen_113_part_00